jgi:hypothetical protein
MAEKNDWYLSTRPTQRAMYANVFAKIDLHQPVLDLEAAKLTRLKMICQNYIAIYDWLEQMEATKGQCYEWRDDMEKGDTSEPIQPPPVFLTVTLQPFSFKGFVTEFREIVGHIKELDGYTEAIGLDLMIVRAKGTPPNLNEVFPDLRYDEKAGFKVRVTGSMKGFKSANFYYRRRGENNYFFVAYLNSLPGELTVPAAVPGQPEVGDIKAIFVEKNEEVGIFSDNTEIRLF